MALSSVKGRWAVVLGASSGMGEAVSVELSKLGMNILGVHLDRKSTLPHVEEIQSKIKANGVKSVFFNVNAADKEKRKEVIEEIRKHSEGVGAHCLVHSLAFGTLKPFFGESPQKSITKEQMDMTCDVMAHSLVYWTQDLYQEKLLPKGAKVFAMTSSGSTRSSRSLSRTART